MITRMSPHIAVHAQANEIFSTFAAPHLNTSAINSVPLPRKPKLVKPVTLESFLRIKREIAAQVGGFDPSTYRLYGDYVVFVQSNMIDSETYLLTAILFEDQLANVSQREVDDIEWCRYSEITLRVAGL
ncbi:hypothetical protein [Vibrio phage V-YDF132]|nr:hypothetical protein [Vibrio phage V-YDF132]